MKPKYKRPPQRIFVRHDRVCETCGVLFDCQNPRQWVCDACQEKRKALTLPAPHSAITIGERIGGRLLGKDADQIRKWARGK